MGGAMAGTTLAAIFLVATIGGAAAITAPNTSLATVPCGYFGGNAGHRGQPNIEMLAKMRIVMLEKWEGPCWTGCLSGGSSSADCSSTCAVENYILDTHRRVKALNPSVCSVLYLNTLMDFSFYSLHGVFVAHDMLTIDSSTGQPLTIVNDNGMHNIYVWGFDKPGAVALYTAGIQNLTSLGIDGFFGDKWDKGATPSKHDPDTWQICNKGCGSVTASQGAAWNAGKKAMLSAVTQLVGAGPYFANGNDFEGVGSNFNGHWSTTKTLKSGDPRDLISDVQNHLVNHTYVYVSSVGDQHWTTDPNDPASLVADCTGDCLARFLLAVEKGCFLGTNGWAPEYELPLGDPLGPAEYKPAAGSLAATLSRNFSSGTYVIFTYDRSGHSGNGVVYWGGKPPPPPPPPLTIQCGETKSTLMRDTTFAQDDVSETKADSAVSCCNACAANPECAEWAWHGSTDQSCHLHSKKASEKSQSGTTAGVMQRK